MVEADEADGTFVRLGAEGVIVTNVEPDHLDYFGDEMALASAFERFVSPSAGAAHRVRRRQDGVCTGRRRTGRYYLRHQRGVATTGSRPLTLRRAGRGSKYTLEERALGASS